MKKFTCTEKKLIHHDDQDNQTIIMHEGDSLTLRDDLSALFCSYGWGEADGVEKGERKVGVTKLKPVGAVK